MMTHNISMSAHSLRRDYAQKLASEFGFSFARPTPQSEFHLYCDVEHLELQGLRQNSSGPIFVNFVSGKANFRRLHGGGKNQTLAKAIGINKRANLHVVDATAGMGQDGFVMATLGCQVTFVERSPVFAALLADGLYRAGLVVELNEINQRLRLHHADSRQFLDHLSADEQPDVIYLDPMYPKRRKSALVKKEMRYAQVLLGSDCDTAELLKASLLHATNRVVVKRPKLSPYLADHKPCTEILSKNTRYDIYLIQNHKR